MRFTSKLKKKINDFSNKLNKNDSFDKIQCQDDNACAQNTLERSVSKPKYADCKYYKFVPRIIGKKCQDQYDLVYLYDINVTDAKQSRLKHLQIIARFIFSSAFCINSRRPQYILQLNKKLEKDTKTCRTNASDKDTMYMLKISKEFQKVVKKTITEPDVYHFKKNNEELSAYCQRLSLNKATHQIMTERETLADQAENQRDERLKETDGINNSAIKCDINSAKPCTDPAVDDCCMRYRTSSDYSRIEVNNFQKRSCLSNPCVSTDGNFSKHAVKDTNQVLEIQYSSRFGEINERHCNAVLRLVNQRLTGKCSILPFEVCIFIQENIKDFEELVNLRLDLIYKCLNTYFFPGKDVVTVSVQRDLKQFLCRTVFQSSPVVKDLFGERHHIEDDLNIRAVLMVSSSISALLRHQDVCLLDTLPLILGIDRDTLLVLKL